MDILTVLTIIFFFMVAGLIALVQMINSRYPPVNISVSNSKIRDVYSYRLLGHTIVTNNIFMLLMNNFEVCGDIRELEYDLVPSRFLILTTGYYKLYRAYLRYGYLTGLKHEGINTPEILKDQPIVWTTKNAKMSISNKGLLMPFKLQLTNETLKEKEVTNGKAICARFIESQRANRQFNDTTNPLFTTLIYSIPLFLVVVGLGIVIYLGMSSASDSALLTVKAASDMTAHIDSLTNQSASLLIHVDKLSTQIANMK